MNFTPEQLDAVDAGRPPLDTCVTAGPGSGKTTVLVEYFRRLVAAGADPLRILAITFTEKAAANMRKKLAEAFQAESETRARLERAWVSTVHGFCARLLRENAVFAGIDPEFRVADERESWRWRQTTIAEAVEALFRERPAAVRDLIRGLSSPDCEEAILDAYDALRGAGVRAGDLADFRPPPGRTQRDVALTLEELAADPADGWSRAQREHLDAAIEGAERILSAEGPLEGLRAVAAFSVNLQKCKRGTAAYDLIKRLRDETAELKYTLITAFHGPQRELLLELLRRFDVLYRERKRQAGALDFADLEEFAVRLLAENGETRERLQAQFAHILMDEYQDTNPQQARLLNLLRTPGRFYAVGDVNQSIYGFRHAEPDVFRRFRAAAERNGRCVELTGNYRSRADILRAVETVAAGAAGIEPRRLRPQREFEDAVPVSVECAYLRGADAASALRAEARWVARRALELGFGYRDIAVLVRNTEVIPEFTSAFEEAGIPYLVNRGRGFYENPEAQDLASLLRVIANPRDEIALAAVLRSPLVGVSADALLQLRLMGENMGAALAAQTPAPPAFEASDAVRLQRFRERLREWRMRREHVSFDRLLLTAMDESGYRFNSSARGAAVTDKFLAQARAASARMSLDEFVEELALLRDENPREPDAPPDDGADAVKVMTIHSAKGLEFPVVFVAALHKGVETTPPPVAFLPGVGLGTRWRNPACREEKDDLFQHELRKRWKERDEREGDRLLYVAMTRAEQRLILSFSGKGEKPANWAADVVGALDLDLAEPRGEVLTRVTPGSEEWKLRLVVAEAGRELAGGSACPTLVREPLQRGAGASACHLPVDEVEPPLIANQQDGDATVTALTTFANCPRAYYLGNYLGFKTERLGGASRGIPAAELGSQTHALLAGDSVPDADPEAARLADVFRQSPLGRRAARARRLEREFDFVISIEDLVVRGQIDLWFEENGELVLVDYKTDDVTRAQAHERARDYGLQLRLYAMAVERIAGRPPDRAWLCFLKPDLAVESDLALSLLDSPEQVVRDFQEAQDKLDFPMREGERCARCPFVRGLCPAGYTSGKE
ncbi:MAG: UvrD-helicase domain-containing protein [Bryobacteraceae bacterium]